MVATYTTVSGFLCLRNATHFITSNEKPKIYAACLSAYKKNKVHGVWVDATQSVKEIELQVSKMVCWSPYLTMHNTTFYAIHCHEGFYNLKLDINADIEYIRAQALFIAKHGELGAKLIAHYEGTVEAAEEVINQRYQGEYNSQLEYATQLFDKLYLNTIPEHIQFCVDYEAFKTAIFEHYFFSIELKGMTHVFFEYLGDWDFRQCLDDFLKPYKCTLPING